MSKGSALVSILFAFLSGVVMGFIISSNSSGTEPVADAHEEAGEKAGAAPAPSDDGVQRYKVPVTAAQPTKGPADALVTIVTISEFQCPFCKRVEPTLKQLEEDYKGKVRFVWRNNPLPF